MRAGLLTDTISFYSISNTKSSSGAIIKNKTLVISSRCQVLKNTGKNGVLNSEEFNSNLLEVKVRYNPIINETLKVLLRGKTYKIENIFLNKKDNSYSISLKKVDE
jgi:hypothetical protein